MGEEGDRSVKFCVGGSGSEEVNERDEKKREEW